MGKGLGSIFESLKGTDVLKVGESITLEKDVPTLFGRADRAIDGFDIHQIDGLADNLKVSSYGLQVVYDGNKVVYSRPDFSSGGKPYKASNRIIVEDTLHKKFDIDDTCDAGIGGGLYRICVADAQVKNGFVLEVAGNNMLRLIATINNGESRVAEHIS